MKRDFKLIDVLKPSKPFTDPKDLVVLPMLINFKDVTISAKLPSDAARKFMKRFCQENNIETKCTLVMIFEQLPEQYEDKPVATDPILYGYSCCRYLLSEPKKVDLKSTQYYIRHQIDVLRLAKPICKRIRKQRDRDVKKREVEIKKSRQQTNKPSIKTPEKPQEPKEKPKKIDTPVREPIPVKTPVRQEHPAKLSIRPSEQVEESEFEFVENNSQKIISMVPKDNINWTNKEKREFLEKNIKV